MTTSRRRFLSTASSAGLAVAAAFRDDAVPRLMAASAATAGRSPDEVARDEDFWREIQLAFTLDRSIINLNNGGVCPSPRVVHEAFKRYLDISNQSPVYHMWQVLEPNIESVRRKLAVHAGCDHEELAITRNASEALMIAQLGIDLAPGDEVLTTNQDYPRMLDTWDQRERRDKVKIVRISFPVPPPSMADLVDRIERAITPRTKVLHVCHITNLTGQIFPVRDICRMARARGVRTIVDGAHAFAHFPFAIRDLECDYYGTSLHKWLLAPVGTGFLYVRRELIRDLWGLTPTSASRAGDIRKFEEVGTHPAANHQAIAEAIAFHETIGVERKVARLRYLRDRFARRLLRHDKVRMLTNLDDPAQAGGLSNVSVTGIDPGRIVSHLWTTRRILVTPIIHDEFQGIRVTPNVYTMLSEIDAFAEAMEDVVTRGLPAPA